MKLFQKPEKTTTSISSERVLMELSMRYSVIKNLSPANLVMQLDTYNLGELSGFVLLARDCLQRDPILSSLEKKRRRSVSRLPWEIVQFEDTPEAERQKQILEELYGSLRVTSVINEDLNGGVRLLIRQMLNAVNYGWNVHETIWKPTATGITVQLRDVPLQFFEHRTSNLRFMRTIGDYNGEELQAAEWLVTCADEALAIPATILYLYKHLPLRDWIIYCQRYVVPGLHGKTPATKGSNEWNDLVSALKNFSIDFALVTNTGADISTIDVSAKGELPYEKLIERCERAMSILYRGGDLSTMSSVNGQGTGASVQASESDIFLEDDAALIEETLERNLSAHAIRYCLGDVPTLAQFKLTLPRKQDTTQQLAIDEKLIAWGCAVAKTDLLERYGRPQPEEGEELAKPAAPAFQPMSPAPAALPNATLPGAPTMAENIAENVATRLETATRPRLLTAMANDLAPLREKIEHALAGDDAGLNARLKELQNQLPALLTQICRNPAAQQVLEDAYTAALFNGLAEGASITEGSRDV